MEIQSQSSIQIQNESGHGNGMEQFNWLQISAQKQSGTPGFIENLNESQSSGFENGQVESSEGFTGQQILQQAKPSKIELKKTILDFLRQYKQYHRKAKAQFDQQLFNFIFCHHDVQNLYPTNQPPKNQQFLNKLIYHYFKGYLSGGQTIQDLNHQAEPAQIRKLLNQQGENNLEYATYQEKIPGIFTNFLSSLQKCSQIIKNLDEQQIDQLLNPPDLHEQQKSLSGQEQQTQNNSDPKKADLVRSIKSLIQWCVKQDDKSVRSVCSKNIIQFFGKLIFPSIFQKLKKVYSDMTQGVQQIQKWSQQKTQTEISGILDDYFKQQKQLNIQQIQYKPLLLKCLRDKKFLYQKDSKGNQKEKEIKTEKQLRLVLGTEQVVDLWEEILMTEKSLYLKVKESDNIKQNMRNYYICFIPRLLEIVKKIQQSQKSPQKQQMEEQRKEEMKIPQTKKIKKYRPGKKYKEMSEQQKRQHDQKESKLAEMGQDRGIWWCKIKQGIKKNEKNNATKKQFSQAVSMSRARQIEERCLGLEPGKVLGVEQQIKRVESEDQGMQQQ